MKSCLAWAGTSRCARTAEAAAATAAVATRRASPLSTSSHALRSPRLPSSAVDSRHGAPTALVRTALLPVLPIRNASSTSSSSSERWKARATRDPYAARARIDGLKSRAAYKLLELDARHRLFRQGRRQTVVDLGFAPGAWSQVAVNRVGPGGRVLGVDVIPAMPPRGASSIQGDFLSEAVRDDVRRYVAEWGLGRARARGLRGVVGQRDKGEGEDDAEGKDEGVASEEGRKDEHLVVDVVLSDMSAPWPLTSGAWIKSVSNPYFRMMNTSGVAFKDHAGSMDLCLAALTFAYDTLVPGGHFVCKFYQGAEEKSFELRLKKLFEKVVREKPDSSRKESREAYFVALRRKPDVERSLVFPEDAAAADDKT